MLRTVIIDDEDHIRDSLAKLLEMDCPEVNVIGQASGLVSGVAVIRQIS
jgi:YesN/AraC family two-component response regulator